MQTENIINSKIRAFHRRKAGLILAAGTIHLIVFLSVIWISTFAADTVLYFSRSVRWFVLIVNSSLSLYLFYRFIGEHLIQLFHSINMSHKMIVAAREIGYLKPEIADRLLNTYQLQSTQEKFSSPELRRFAVNRFSEMIKNDDFRSLLNLRSFIIPYSWIVLILLGGVLLSAFMGNQLSVSLKRVLNPAGDYQLIQDYRFKVMPGDTTIIAGYPFDVRADFLGPSVGQLKIEVLEPEKAAARSIELEKKGPVYIASITGMRSSFNYYVSAVPLWEIGQEQVLKSDQYQVRVITPPAVNDLQITITPPAYTGLEKSHLEPNIGDVLAYRGSTVDFSARLNKEVQSVVLVFSSGESIPATVRGRSASAEFSLKDAGSYQIHLLDKLNIANEDPINYRLETMEDLIPSVSLIEPGQDIDISPDAALNLVFEGRDDFGFSRMWLSYQIISSLDIASDSTWRQIPLFIPTGQQKYFQQQFLWQFTNISVGFGDAIKYYLALSDNDRINGPKTGFSGTYLINFPTIEQVFAAIDQKQQESIEENEKINDESERLRETLEQITREMKRDKEIDWERQKQIESALNKQNEIQDKLDKIQENLEETLRKLDQSQMISPEVLEKYQQLQKLFQEIASPELLKSMQSLQEALEKLDQNEIEKSLEDFKQNQEKFAENLDRTLELFRKVQFEQELDRLNKMAEKALRDQKTITDNLSNRADIEEQIQQQNRQDELIAAIRENLEKLMQNDLLTRYPEAQQELMQSEAQLNSGQLEQLSQELKNQLHSGKQNSAVAKSKDLSTQLNQIQSQIANAQKKILDTDRQNLSEQLQKSTANLLKLSQEQESLMKKTADAGSLSDRFRDLAGEQQKIATNMIRVVENIVEISRETFMLSPEVGQAMASAGEGMQKSINELENRNKAGSGSAQSQAMGALNRAAMAMQNTMEGMSAAGSALGFEEFMQRMQQMAGQQGQLNQDGMNLFQGQGNSGILSAEGQQRLRQMAAEQRALQKSMEQLNGEIGRRSDVLGRLDNIAGEMEEVVNDLEKLRLDRKTIERQQKILSRMLDAQKSMREQEYSRQRQAEIGKEYSRKSPNERQEREDRELKRLQDELMRALQEGYNPDYEKIIEEYFRILGQLYLNEKSDKH